MDSPSRTKTGKPHEPRWEVKGWQGSKLAPFIETLQAGVVLLGSGGECLALNPSAEDILELEGLPWQGRDILLLMRGTPFHSALSRALLKGEGRDGSPIRIFCSQGGYELRVLGPSLLSIEIPGQVLLIERVPEKRELERKKNEFLALISHELRTPLTVIKGYLDILNKGMLGELNEAQAKTIAVMLDQCKGLETILTDLIRFGMLSRGEDNATPEAVNLSAFLREHLERVRKESQGQGAELSLVVPDPQLACLCDRDHLADVLRHLVDNALKFGGKGTKIEVSAERFSLADLPPRGQRITKDDPSPHKKWIRLEVRDNGPGIPRALMERIFESFEQVEDYMTRRSSGLGLGLAMVKRIVETYEGALWIRTGEGWGTSVSLLLPMVDVSGFYGRQRHER